MNKTSSTDKILCLYIQKSYEKLPWRKNWAMSDENNEKLSLRTAGSKNNSKRTSVICWKLEFLCGNIMFDIISRTFSPYWREVK